MELDDDGKRLCRPSDFPIGKDKWVIRSLDASSENLVGLCSIAIYRSLYGIGGTGSQPGRRYGPEAIFKKIMEPEEW